MLYIHKGQKSRLPRKFRPISNICAHIYDQLTEILTEDHYRQLLSTDISTGVTTKGMVEELERGDLHALDWLAKNSLDKELVEVLTKHIVLSVVSDFVNFMYESLRCAINGKFTVAYALLRKPLTDELLILEQILYDKEEFIRKFYHKGEPNEYDPGNKAIDREKVIQNAFSKLKLDGIYSPDLIYKLRYDKSCPAGINGISNSALHIVTLDKNYKTSNQNLNFVFSTEEDHQRYLNHYYYFVPYLLMYSAAVVDEIVFGYLRGDEFQKLKTFKSFRRFVGFLLWTEKTKVKSRKDKNDLAGSLYDVFMYECKDCNHNGTISMADYELFFETGMLLCENCTCNILNSEDSFKSINEFLKILDKVAGNIGFVQPGGRL